MLPATLRQPGAVKFKIEYAESVLTVQQGRYRSNVAGYPYIEPLFVASEFFVKTRRRGAYGQMPPISR